MVEMNYPVVFGKTALTVLALTLCLMVGWSTRADAQAADTRGPVVNAHMSVVADAEGVQATGYRSTRLPDVTLPGQAKWIGPADGPGGVILLRKTVILDGAPQKVLAGVTAGTRFQLYVNSRLAERGLADAGRDFDGGSSHHWFYDCRDFTPLFHTGKNVLAVVVFGGAPFLFQAQAQLGEGKSVTIASDET